MSTEVEGEPAAEQGEGESLPCDMSLGAGAGAGLEGGLAALGLQGEPGPAPPALDKQERSKVDILLKATGNAPIMKKKKWAVDAEKPIGWIMEFVKKYLKLEPEEKLFLYVNQTFAPSPDQIVRNLYECFGTDGKLVLHYCKSQAWG